MRAWIGRSEAPLAADATARATAAAGSWVRLGKEVLVIGETRDELAGRVPDPGAFRGPVEVADLRLVTQIGQLFQREHPDVPVVLDKGRYLVVDVGRQDVPTPDHGCWTMQPLPLGTTVFEERGRPSPRRPALGRVKELVDRVQGDALQVTLEHLVSFRTRHSTSEEFSDVASWAQVELEALGYSTRLEPVRVGAGTSRNVVADKLGNGPGPRRLVVIVAHLDSVNTLEGPNGAAPGADDNGSGSAGLLEIARVLHEGAFTHDLRLILFGGEEQGLHGSQQHVAALPSTDRDRIVAVINMDMIGGRNTAEATVLVEGAARFQDLIDAAEKAAVTYTSLTVQTSTNPFNSDHVSFLDAGIPAVLTIEGADSANQRVHTADDDLDHVDFELAAEIVRMNVATAATALDPAPRTTPGSPSEATSAEPAVAPVTPSAVQLSGRYTCNGGAGGRIATSAGGRRLTTAELTNPLYRLEEPVYISGEPPVASPVPVSEEPAFTLHVDIDGTDPLAVVSGYVASGRVGAPAAHFIGRVTSDSPGESARAVVVEDFRFAWPGSTNEIDVLQLDVIAAPGAPPAADVTFVATAPNRRYGPYRAVQQSTYFREVHVEVDTQDRAVAVEPYVTTTHPVRPPSDTGETLTFESAFAKSGISIVRSPSGNVINSSTAGENRRWNSQELHDAMESHWSAFANVAQWKMWIFLAELADDDGLGGIMFDGNIDEPGGVDRQGTAVFTLSPHFHTAEGAYPQANPPAAEAARRELFFNLLHETGHAFNLAHSFQKRHGLPWEPPPWMPLEDVPQSLSFMNYPDEASPGGGLSAVWFYERFGWRFDDGENLFLRHAPHEFVEMGNQTWFENHGRVTRGSVDPRLELTVRSRTDTLELGEPVFVEFRLRNRSEEPVAAHRNLYPSDGLLEVAVTNPRRERRPWIPIAHTRSLVKKETLPPADAFYQELNMTMGQFGFAFKEPGPYRIEASYRNVDGGTAAGVLQLHVRPPASYDDRRTISALFDARVGRVLQVGGSRLMDDANDKLDWVKERLGQRHPASYYLDAVRAVPLAQPYKLLEGDAAQVKVDEEDPEYVYQRLRPLIEEPKEAADAVGHIVYRRFVDTFTDSALAINKRSEARRAQSELLELFRQRNVVQPVVEEIEDHVRRVT